MATSGQLSFPILYSCLEGPTLELRGQLVGPSVEGPTKGLAHISANTQTEILMDVLRYGPDLFRFVLFSSGVANLFLCFFLAR